MGAVTFRSAATSRKSDITVAGNFTVNHDTLEVSASGIKFKLTEEGLKDLMRKMSYVATGRHEIVGG